MNRWTDVAAEADLFEGAGIAVTPCGHDIALFSVDGQVFATDNLCSHGNARLCDGFIEGLEIECPFHQGRFDLKTGAATLAPASQAIKVWPVKIEAGRVWLDLT
jgi:naphthalene 1,2-dioxygenase system ferredoxin subunit